MYIYSADKLEYYLDNLKNKNYIIEEKKGKDDTICLIKDIHSYEEADSITSLFTEYARMRSRIIHNMSPYEFWRKNYYEVVSFAVKEYRLRLNTIPNNINEIANMRPMFQKIAKDAVYALHEAMYRLCKEATTFSPVLSKYIYEKYLPNEGGIVFDPFGGWGDRMIGAICCDKVKKYSCVDANRALIEGYENIKKIENGNKVDYIIMDTLKYLPGENTKYDIVFTSPPYFDYEIYTNYRDADQSIYNRDYSKWISEFYEPIIKGCIRVCKLNGYIIFHVGNTNACPNLVSDTKNIIEKYGAKHMHTLNIRTGSKRPVPILVYKKI
jgi:16S rRNA G966 N2-methylase RsmD